MIPPALRSSVDALEVRGYDDIYAHVVRQADLAKEEEKRMAHKKRGGTLGMLDDEAAAAVEPPHTLDENGELVIPAAGRRAQTT